MTTQPRHDRLDERPFWTVQSVFDPEGGGSDFAYTIGLHERGRPELHLWARPDRGDDPGDDWMLSPNDRCHLLNELAWQLLRGDLAVGQTVTRELDAGAVTMQMEIGPPRDPESLDAFQAHPEAVVWPVSWSLTRPLEGANEPLEGAALAQAEADFRAAVGLIDTGLIDTVAAAAVPAGWEVPSRPSYDPEQLFGPRTPVVLARAARFWTLGPARVDALLRCGIDAELGGSLTLPVSVARTAARGVGRRPALERLADAVTELVGRFATTASLDRAETSLLSDLLHGCLAVEVVADVVDQQWLLAGRGPFLAGLGEHEGGLPGPEWAASPGVVAAVLGLLDGLPGDRLAELATMHDVGLAVAAGDGAVYCEVVARLHGWSLVGPAGFPWPWGEERFAGPTRAILQEWGSCVTAAICHRAWLADDEVRVFAAPFRELLPVLEELLNTPVVQPPE